MSCSDILWDSAASTLIHSPISLKVDQATVRDVPEAAALEAGLSVSSSSCCARIVNFEGIVKTMVDADVAALA